MYLSYFKYNFDVAKGLNINHEKADFVMFGFFYGMLAGHENFW